MPEFETQQPRMRAPVVSLRRRRGGIDDEQAAPGGHALIAHIRQTAQRAAFGVGERESRVDQKRLLLDAAMKKRETAVAVAQQFKRGQHGVDGGAQRVGGFDSGGFKRFAQIDEIAQHMQLHRRAARNMPAVGQNLVPDLTLQKIDGQTQRFIGVVEIKPAIDEAFDRAQARDIGQGRRQSAQ
jgi:hypothetical protein